MMMDEYELTMANAYFNDPTIDNNTRVSFDVFYRVNPDGGGFAIFAGLQQVKDYLLNMHFTDEDIEYLRSVGHFTENFLEYLKDFKFTGDVDAFPEGTITSQLSQLLPLSSRRSLWRQRFWLRLTTSL